jgi:hypothetical protein
VGGGTLRESHYNVGSQASRPRLSRWEGELFVTPYRPWLDESFDDAVLWIIAHESGHVTFRVGCGSLAVGRVAYTRGAGTDDEYRSVTSRGSGGERGARGRHRKSLEILEGGGGLRARGQSAW